MKVCCCSLAGTRACLSCSNAPINLFEHDLDFIEKRKTKPLKYKRSWSVTSLSDLDEETEN